MSNVQGGPKPNPNPKPKPRRLGADLKASSETKGKPKAGAGGATDPRKSPQPTPEHTPVRGDSSKMDGLWDKVNRQSLLVSEKKPGSAPRAASEGRPGTEVEHTPEDTGRGRSALRSGSDPRAASEGRPETEGKPTPEYKVGEGAGANPKAGFGRSASVGRQVKKKPAVRTRNQPAPKQQETIAEMISSGSLKPDAIKDFIADRLAKPLDQAEQEDIASAIVNGRFGEQMSEEVAMAIATNLYKFKSSLAATNSISKSIFYGRFGKPMSEDVALAIAAKLDVVENSDDARVLIKVAIMNGLFGKPIPETVAVAMATNYEKWYPRGTPF